MNNNDSDPLNNDQKNINMLNNSIPPQHGTSSSTDDSNEIMDNSQQVSPQESGKQYSTIACLLCRKAHRKCDRLYPVCSECNCRGLADKCSYQQPKKRGPKNANINLTSTPPLTKIPPSSSIPMIPVGHTTISITNNATNMSRRIASPPRKNIYNGLPTHSYGSFSETISSDAHNNGSFPNNHQQQTLMYDAPPSASSNGNNYQQHPNPSYSYSNNFGNNSYPPHSNNYEPSGKRHHSNGGSSVDHPNHRYHPYPSTQPLMQSSNTTGSSPPIQDRYISKRELASSLSMLRNITSYEGFDMDMHSSQILDLYFNRYIMGYPLIKREDLENVISRRLSRHIRIPPITEEKDEYYICSFYCICMLVFQRIGKKSISHSFYARANQICSRLLFYEEEDIPENKGRVGLNFELCMIVSLLCIYSIGNGDFKKASMYYNIGMSFIQQVNLFSESERGFLIAYYGFCELMLFNETRDQIKCFSIIVNKHVKGNLNFIHSSQFQTLDSCLDILQILHDKQKNIMQPKNFDIPEGYESILQNRFDIINTHFDFLRLGLEIKAILTFSPSSYTDERLKQLADYILNLTSTPSFEDASALIVEPMILSCRIILKHTDSYYDPNSMRACLLSLHSLDKRFSSVRKVYGDVFDAIETRYLSYNNSGSNNSLNVPPPTTTNYQNHHQ